MRLSKIKPLTLSTHFTLRIFPRIYLLQLARKLWLFPWSSFLPGKWRFPDCPPWNYTIVYSTATIRLISSWVSILFYHYIYIFFFPPCARRVLLLLILNLLDACNTAPYLLVPAQEAYRWPHYWTPGGLSMYYRAHRGTTEPTEALSSPQRHYQAHRGTSEPAEALSTLSRHYPVHNDIIEPVVAWFSSWSA